MTMTDTGVKLALEEMRVAMEGRHGYSWEHEVGRVMKAVEAYVEPQRVCIPAADPKILEDALKEVFRIVYGVHVHGEKKERLPFALAYITEQLEKYRAAGNKTADLP
jgi:hypothetical protein